MANSVDAPNEETGLLQPGVQRAGTGTISANNWWRRNEGALPTAFLTAFVIGVNEGYNKNTNTIYIGKDMDEMQDGVLIILLPIMSSIIVPPLVPTLRRNCSQRASMLIGPTAMAIGFLGSGIAGVAGSYRSLWLIALFQTIAGVGVGLLNMLTYLAIREATPDSQNYSSYRAVYQGVMASGMLAGALGGPVIIRNIEARCFATGLRPWQFPFLLECLFALILLLVIYCNPSSRERGEFQSGSGGSDSLETMWAVLCTGIPIVLCNILIQWGFHAIYWVTASILWLTSAIFLLTGWTETTSLYSVNVVRSGKVWLLIISRATMSAAVQTLLLRLPFYSQVRMMIEAGTGGQQSRLAEEALRQGYNAKVKTFRFPHPYDAMLPVYNIGQLVGEFGAAAIIKQLARESTPLGASLPIYFLLVQLFGNGLTGPVSGASVMIVTLFAGISNGLADNCLASFLFAVVADVDRPGAEALSSQAANIASAASLTYTTLQYKSLLREGLVREYGEKIGAKFSDMALKSISAVDSFPSGPRNVTLEYARSGIESNIRQVGFVLVSGVFAAGVLYGTDSDGSARTDLSRGIPISA